jgi:hypothetical protein
MVAVIFLAGNVYAGDYAKKGWKRNKADRQARIIERVAHRIAKLEEKLVMAKKKYEELTGVTVSDETTDEVPCEPPSAGVVICEKCDLRGSQFPDHNFMDAEFKEANFQNAILTGTNFSGAYLELAEMIGANLEGADLRNAILAGAKLESANLKGADLSNAVIAEVRWTLTTMICDSSFPPNCEEKELSAICPDGSYANAEDDKSCENNLTLP